MNQLNFAINDHNGLIIDYIVHYSRQKNVQYKSTGTRGEQLGKTQCTVIDYTIVCK